MTESKKTMAKALAQCTFCPGISTKRFARDIDQETGEILA